MSCENTKTEEVSGWRNRELGDGDDVALKPDPDVCVSGRKTAADSHMQSSSTEKEDKREWRSGISKKWMQMGAAIGRSLRDVKSEFIDDRF